MKLIILDIIKHLLNFASSFNNFRYYPNVFILNKGEIKISRKSAISKYCELKCLKNSTITIENKSWIGKNCELSTLENSKIFIGENCTINNNTKILGDIRIYNNVSIAPNVFISSGSHNFKYEPFMPIKEQDKLYPVENNKIIIEEDVWIGANCTIGNKSYLAKGVIVAANSFINSKTYPYEIWGGVPAKKIGIRAEFIPPDSLKNIIFSPYLYRGFNLNICNNYGIIVLKYKKEFNINLNSFDQNNLIISNNIDNFSSEYFLKKGNTSINIKFKIIGNTEFVILKFRTIKKIKIHSIL